MTQLVLAPQTVQDDHRDLLSLVDSLRRRLASGPWRDPMVGSLLSCLNDHLEVHFQNEESNGFFDDLLDMRPHLAPRIDALQLEHSRLLNRVDDLRHRYQYDAKSAFNWRRLNDAFERFRQMLLAHEREEGCLLLEAHTQDEGSKD